MGAPSVHQGQEHQDQHGPVDGRVEQADVEHYEGVLLNPVQVVLTVWLDLLGQIWTHPGDRSTPTLWPTYRACIQGLTWTKTEG